MSNKKLMGILNKTIANQMTELNLSNLNLTECPREISPGSKWGEDIEKAVKSARIAILVISQDFLASDFIVENELPHLLQSAQKGGTKIIQLIVRPSTFESCTDLAQFQTLNDPKRPLSGLQQVEQEKIFVKLADTIAKYCTVG